MKRHAFITLISGCVLWPLVGRTQHIATMPRVGFLGNSTAALEANLVGAFRDGLRELGYEEGRNILIDYRWADGKYHLFPALAAELLAEKVAVIVTAGTPAVLAAKKTTNSVPIVMVAVGDPPVRNRTSLARPGGSVTGLAPCAGTGRKRLEMLKEFMPNLSRM